MDILSVRGVDKEVQKALRVRAAETGETIGAIVDRALRRELGMMLEYQVIEDSGGGLHLAVFEGDGVIYYASGLEYLPVADVQEMLQALRDGTNPVDDGWESDLPDGYTPQRLYDELTSYEYGWTIIADETSIYPNRMGAAGRTAFGLDD
jgi:hypothetical protein